MEPGKGRPRLIGRSLELDDGPVWVTSSGLITSRLGQVSLTKPTYRRIVLRCCSVPQAKPSPDYEYRISLRPHPVGHPSSSTRDSASRAVPSSIRVRRDGYREAGEWQQAGGDQRDRAAQKVFARAGSRKPRSDQHQECSTTDNHGYRRLACFRSADCAGRSATSRGARCATRVSLPLDLPPDPIALLAGPARWRWIAQCEKRSAASWPKRSESSQNLVDRACWTLAAMLSPLN